MHLPSTLSSNPIEAGAPDQMEGLSALEQMGVYFSSQIHDLNNQMACLSNTSLLLEMTSESLPEATSHLLQGMSKAIQRLSRSVADFNTIRRTVKVRPTYVDQSEIAESIRKNSFTGWTLQTGRSTNDAVRADTHWLGIIVARLIDLTGAATGTIRMSTGPLPARRYSRTITTDPDDLFLRLHFTTDDSFGELGEVPPPGGLDHEMTLELIRLMGAVISFGHGDRPDDLLLAMRLESI